MKNRLIGGTLIAALAFTGINEGIKYAAYQDIGGTWTICNGITKNVKMGDIATPEQCQSSLVKELMNHANPLEKIPHQLPDNVLIAWSDFCFNVGAGLCQRSSGYKLLQQGKIDASCHNILQYRYAAKKDCFLDENAKVCGGIKKRRYLEFNLCKGNITIEQAIKSI